MKLDESKDSYFGVFLGSYSQLFVCTLREWRGSMRDFTSLFIDNRKCNTK